MYITFVTNMYSILAFHGTHVHFPEQIGSLISAIVLSTGDMFGRSGPILILGVNCENKVNPIIRFKYTLGWVKNSNNEQN